MRRQGLACQLNLFFSFVIDLILSSLGIIFTEGKKIIIIIIMQYLYSALKSCKGYTEALGIQMRILCSLSLLHLFVSESTCASYVQFLDLSFFPFMLCIMYGKNEKKLLTYRSTNMQYIPMCLDCAFCFRFHFQFSTQTSARKERDGPWPFHSNHVGLINKAQSVIVFGKTKTKFSLKRVMVYRQRVSTLIS